MTRTRPFPALFRALLLLALAVYVAALCCAWHLNLRDTESTLSHINSMLAQGVRTTLNGHDLILCGLGAELIAQGALEEPELGRRLIERIKSIDPGMIGFGLARPDGQLVLVSGIGSDQGLPNLMDHAETRDSFRRVLESDRLRTGRPYFFEGLGNWVLPIRMAVYDDAGEIQAVMTAGYDIERASAAWANTELPPGIQIVLMGDDGHLIYAQPTLDGPRDRALARTYSNPVAPDVQARFLAQPFQGVISILE